MFFVLFLVLVTIYAVITLYTWQLNQTRKYIKNLTDPSIEFPAADYRFPFGETLPYTNYDAFVQQYRARFEKWGCFMYWVINTPLVLLTKPEYVKDLMTKPEEFFDRHFAFEFLDTLFGQSLLGATGEVWKKQHRIIQKAFSTSNIPHFFPLIAQVSKKRFIEVHKAAEDGQPIDMNRIFNEIAAEVIMRAAFGCEGKQADQLTETIKQYLNSQSPLIRLPGVNNMKFIPEVKRHWELFDEIKRTGDSICEERRRILREKKEAGDTTPSTTYTFLDLLLEARDDETGAELNDAELKDNCRIFLGAGSETTATAMSWFVYNLIRNPEIYEKVREEVDSVVPDDVEQFSYQHLAKFQYLPLVINESMRVTPSVGIISIRVPAEEMTIGEWLFPKGSFLAFSIPLIHSSAENYEEPEAFKPERWEDGGDKKRPYSFVPFGAGRRVCIGRYFGLLEMKIVLGLFLKLFTFKRTSNDPIQREYHTPVLHLKGGLPLYVYKRPLNSTPQ